MNVKATQNHASFTSFEIVSEMVQDMVNRGYVYYTYDKQSTITTQTIFIYYNPTSRKHKNDML